VEGEGPREAREGGGREGERESQDGTGTARPVQERRPQGQGDHCGAPGDKPTYLFSDTVYCDVYYVIDAFFMQKMREIRQFYYVITPGCFQATSPPGEPNAMNPPRVWNTTRDTATTVGKRPEGSLYKGASQAPFER